MYELTTIALLAQRPSCGSHGCLICVAVFARGRSMKVSPTHLFPFVELFSSVFTSVPISDPEPVRLLRFKNWCVMHQSIVETSGPPDRRLKCHRCEDRWKRTMAIVPCLNASVVRTRQPVQQRTELHNVEDFGLSPPVVAQTNSGFPNRINVAHFRILRRNSLYDMHIASALSCVRSGIDATNKSGPKARHESRCRSKYQTAGAR